MQSEFWNRSAAKYAASPIADPAGYEATLRRVQGLLSPADEVLEVACGTGSTALRLAPHVRRYEASDISPAMIEIAREKLRAQPTPGLQFSVGDAARPGPPPGSMDAVLAFNALHLVADLDATLAALARMLRPGGLLLSKTACLAEMNPLIPRLALPLMKALGRAPHVLVFDAAALRSALQRSGLDVQAEERHGTRGKDFRVFFVARRPGAPGHAAQPG